jgi:hypothetical protein
MDRELCQLLEASFAEEKFEEFIELERERVKWGLSNSNVEELIKNHRPVSYNHDRVTQILDSPEFHRFAQTHVPTCLSVAIQRGFLEIAHRIVKLCSKELDASEAIEAAVLSRSVNMCKTVFEAFPITDENVFLKAISHPMHSSPMVQAFPSVLERYYSGNMAEEEFALFKHRISENKVDQRECEMYEKYRLYGKRILDMLVRHSSVPAPLEIYLLRSNTVSSSIKEYLKTNFADVNQGRAFVSQNMHAKNVRILFDDFL